jgi:hypothetical protein
MLKRRAIVCRYQHYVGAGKKAAQYLGGAWRRVEVNQPNGLLSQRSLDPVADANEVSTNLERRRRVDLDANR